MLKIVKNGKWAQTNPALPILNIKAGDDPNLYSKEVCDGLLAAGWAAEELIKQPEKLLNEPLKEQTPKTKKKKNK